MSKNVLYIVATPIGNLSDITLRALDVLKNVDIIVCEDTRRTGKLLSHYGIKKSLLSCHGYNEKTRTGSVIQELESGKSAAYCSDAGTPGVSDPGSILAAEVRECGYEVIPIPGPTAAASAFSVSGFSGSAYFFGGFLSPKQGRRRRRLLELMDCGSAVIIYESPFRIVKLLGDIADIDSERKVFVAREMTKLHEEYVSGTAGELLDDFKMRKTVKGEIVVCISRK
jgi:16S rRNA (cytidine1402-2'-O)-methyltransferase